MLTFIYDAVAGEPIRDGDADAVITELIAAGAGDPTCQLKIIAATDNVLNALRVAMRKGRIPLSQITLQYHQYYNKYGGKEDCLRTLRLYPSGGISPWPRGFADFTEAWLMELL